MTKMFEERFGSQVMCTSDFLENPTIIVFVHEFGNLRIELDGKPTCDVQMENSYLIDFSKELISWVRKEKYALLDVNVFPRPFASPLPRGHKHVESWSRDVLTYLWDNYIQLSGAKNIIFIGHGPGCHALMELMESRPVGMIRYVNTVIQVVGNMNIPLIPKDADELRAWYSKNSVVIVHPEHPAFAPDARILKRHGRVLQIEESKPIKLIMKGLPLIQDHIRQSLVGTPQ